MTRWGTGLVTSTLPGDRRYVNVPRPLSAPGYSCRIRPGYYFPFLLLRLFLPVRMDGWADLMMSVGKMLRGIYLSLHLRYWNTTQTRNVSVIEFLALFGILKFFIFLLCAAKIQKILAVMQIWTQAFQYKVTFTPVVQFIGSGPSLNRKRWCCFLVLLWAFYK